MTMKTGRLLRKQPRGLAPVPNAILQDSKCEPRSGKDLTRGRPTLLSHLTRYMFRRGSVVTFGRFT
jgi:hypothetical protein